MSEYFHGSRVFKSAAHRVTGKAFCVEEDELGELLDREGLPETPHLVEGDGVRRDRMFADCGGGGGDLQLPQP